MNVWVGEVTEDLQKKKKNSTVRKHPESLADKRRRDPLPQSLGSGGGGASIISHCSGCGPKRHKKSQTKMKIKKLKMFF